MHTVHSILDPPSGLVNFGAVLRAQSRSGPITALTDFLKMCEMSAYVALFSGPPSSFLTFFASPAQAPALFSRLGQLPSPAMLARDEQEKRCQ